MVAVCGSVNPVQGWVSGGGEQFVGDAAAENYGAGDGAGDDTDCGEGYACVKAGPVPAGLVTA